MRFPYTMARSFGKYLSNAQTPTFASYDLIAMPVEKSASDGCHTADKRRSGLHVQDGPKRDRFNRGPHRVEVLEQHFEVSASSHQDHDAERMRHGVFQAREVTIDGEEDIELTGSAREELAILRASPAELLNRLRREFLEGAHKRPGHTLINEKAATL